MGNNEKDLNEQSLEQSNDNLLNEAEQLIWALLDEELDPKGTQRLEELIQENEEVRERYIQCTQLHLDLQQHFDPEAKPGVPKEIKSPVLGQLGDIRPGTDSLPPVQD